MKLAHQYQPSAEVQPVPQSKPYTSDRWIADLTPKVEQVELNYYHPYLAKRNLAPNWAYYFGVGEYQNRLLWSIHDLYGNFAHYVPRVLDDSEPKYDFSGVTKTYYLFNYHRARAARRKAVILVEGFFGAAWVVQAGYPSVVALMGSAMSELQEQYLTRWWEYVILMLDGDKAGRESQESHYKRLLKRGLKGVYRVNLPDKAQPDHLSFEALRALLSAPVQ